MSQDTLNFIFIGLSFALYIVIAVRSKAASTQEYYTAGGGVSPFANGMATVADWMSAATFISMAGTVAGITFTIGYIVYFQFLGGHSDQLLFGITPEGIGFVGMLLNFAVAFSVKAFTGDAPDYVQEMVAEIHIPSGAGVAKNQDFEI